LGIPHGRISLIEDQGTETELEVFFQRNLNPKSKSQQSLRTRAFCSLRGAFYPDQLDLVSGSPSGRRQF
jgi:recombinational DNA repair ATPase RecF